MNSLTEWFIRDLRPSEYRAVWELWDRAGLHWYSREGVDSEASVKKQIESGNCFFLVAEGDSNLIGVIIGSHDARGHGWISRLAVEPSVRRKGLAAQLIFAAEDRFRKLGLSSVLAMIYQENQASVSLFNKSGYNIQDALVLAIKRFEKQSTC